MSYACIPTAALGLVGLNWYVTKRLQYLFDVIASIHCGLCIVELIIMICLYQRVHLDIQVGEHAIDYANVAQKEKLSELQLRVRQLLDQVEQITKEQNYQRVILLNISYF